MSVCAACHPRRQGDYVLVLTSRGHTKLPSMWVMGAYRSLPRPFRKNVQYIVLVRPTGEATGGRQQRLWVLVAGDGGGGGGAVGLAVVVMWWLW